MTDLAFHPELVRFALVLGVCVTILFYDLRQLTSGGIAVPGYLAFAIFLPQVLPGVLVAGLVTWLLVHGLLRRWFLMTKATTFSLAILISAAIHLVLETSLVAAGWAGPGSPLLRGIGYVVPGLLAHDIARQGLRATTSALLTTSAAVAAALLALVAMVPEAGRFHPAPRQGLFPFAVWLVPMVILLSLIAWYGLARFRGLRCGGILGGAYLTILVLQPLKLLLFPVLAMISLLLVRHLLQPHAILFGRRRFAAHLLVGSVLSWAVFRGMEVWAGAYTLSVVAPSLSVLGVLLTGLLANDMDRSGVAPTLLGTLATVIFTLTGSLLVIELTASQRPAYAWPLFGVLATMLVLLFGHGPRRQTGTAAAVPTSRFVRPRPEAAP